MQIKIHRPAMNELEQMQVSKWEIWTCEPSIFEWNYADQETCFIIEGRARVKTSQQDVTFGAGDMVVFPAGLSCIWEVIEPVRKHYRFD